MKKTGLVDFHADDPVSCFKRMMESCYCYGGLTKSNKYILEYKDELGEDTWNAVYSDYSSWLKNNYTVEHNVGTDNEGLTYNRLVPRLDNTNDNI